MEQQYKTDSEIYAVLEREIIDLTLRPGCSLSENPLCTRFGAPRSLIRVVLQRLQENKTLVLNVYRSVGREQVEQYLYRLLDPVLKEFTNRECQDITVQDADKQFVVDFYKYALVGMTLEWIRRDMKTDPAAMTERLGTMIHGDLRRALCRLASNRGGTARDED